MKNYNPYNYLFYKAYALVKNRPKNDALGNVIDPVMYVVVCFVFNVGAILQILDKYFGILQVEDFYPKSTFLLIVEAFTLVLLFIFYYLYKGRYLSIIRHFERKKELSIYVLNPILVIGLYLFFSVMFMIIIVIL